MSAPQMTVAIDDGGRHATAYVPSQAATLDLRGDTEQDLMTAVFAQAHAEARSSGRTITVAVSGGADTAPMRLEVDPDQTIRPAPEQAPPQESSPPGNGPSAARRAALPSSGSRTRAMSPRLLCGGRRPI